MTIRELTDTITIPTGFIIIDQNPAHAAGHAVIASILAEDIDELPDRILDRRISEIRAGADGSIHITVAPGRHAAGHDE